MSFSTELRRAMTRRGMTCRRLAELVGCDQKTIHEARKPTWHPVHSFALAMAEALDWEYLADLSLAANTRQCAYCGSGFIITRTQGVERKHCSKRCQVNDAHRFSRERGRYARQREERERHRKLLDARLTQHQEAVAAFCRECEPEGLCRTAECALRDVSPLPLAKVRAA